MNHPPSYTNLTFTLTYYSRLFASLDSRPSYDIHIFQLMFDSIDSICCYPKYFVSKRVSILIIFQQRCTARVIADSILNLKEKGLLEVKSNPGSSVNEAVKDT